MKKIVSRILFIFVLFLIPLSSFAQEEESTSNSFADAGADLVSAYIWRGVAWNNSPNIQGWGIWGYKNFAVGAWGTVSFNGNYFEPNIFMSYNFAENFSLTITDVDGGAGVDFFNYKSDETWHILDASLAYQLTGSFPLKMLGSVIFYGGDKTISGYDPVTGAPIPTLDDNYSSYFELGLPLELDQTELEFTLGMTTHESLIYGTTDLAIINVGAKISKEIKFNDNFSLPVSFAFIANPDAKRVYTVFMISL